MPVPEHRLGIDVGGTNTDAVIMDAADRIVAKAKVPCTPDITGGITRAIDTVLHAPGADPRRISHVMLGTTHATNAVLERRNLRRVAVIRIGGPATHSVRPMFGWPRDLTDTISVGATIVDGGVEFDGRDLSPLDTDAIARFLGEVGGAAEGIAITSVFAPVSPRHELLAAEIVKRELGEIHVSLSHEIGSIGLLERENATILNGALVGVARDVAEAMRGALAAHHLEPTTFFAQNDGTLMALDHALRYPVLTIGSGPANSVRGAAFLTGNSDSLVVDVGRHLDGRRRAGQRLPHGSRRRAWRSAGSGPTSGCPTWSPSRSAAARWSPRTPAGCGSGRAASATCSPSRPWSSAGPCRR